MDIAKTVKKHGKTYRRILVIGSYPDPDLKQEAYEKRLTEMYASENIPSIIFILRLIPSIFMQLLQCAWN